MKEKNVEFNNNIFREVNLKTYFFYDEGTVKAMEMELILQYQGKNSGSSRRSQVWQSLTQSIILLLTNNHLASFSCVALKF